MTPVLQDGGRFYVFNRPADEASKDGEGRSVTSIWEFAEPVRDFDVAAAQRAREWFLNVIAPECCYGEIAWEQAA